MTVALFYWAGIQNFLIGGAIAAVKRDHISTLLAVVFLTTAVGVMAQFYFTYTDLKYVAPGVVWLPDVVDLLVPTLILLYVARLLGHELPGRSGLYYAPALAVLPFLIGNSVLTHGEGFFGYIRSGLHYGVLGVIFVWKAAASYLVYGMYRAHAERLRKRGRAHLWWPRVMLAFLLACTVLAAARWYYMVAVAPYYEAGSLQAVRQIMRFTFAGFNSIIVLAVTYYLLRYPEVLSGKPFFKVVSRTEERQRSDHRDYLVRKVEEDRVYLRDDLNEASLAEHLGLPAYVVSRILNEEVGQTFSTFINGYRVAEAQRILRDDPEKVKTNFAVALESGFRSESVFYVNFKKVTGTTPSRYRKAVMAEAA